MSSQPPENLPRGHVAVEEPSKIQKVVAARMIESRASIPDFVLTAEMDATALAVARTRTKAHAADAPAPTVNDVVVKACATALQDFPRVNGAYRDGRFELYERINVGVVVAADQGLFVPTVYDADRKSLAEIATLTRDLSQRAREGRLTQSELEGGTFTVSNLGMFGVTSVAPIINPPQAAVLGVGSLADNSGRPSITLTFVGDHRILNGADGARFLGRLRALLEDGEAGPA